MTQVGLLDAVGSGKPIQLSLQGQDLRELERLTAALMPRLAAIPGLVDLDSSSKPNKPEVSIRVKRDAASDMGLSVGAITRRCARWWPARRWATGAPRTTRTTTSRCGSRPSRACSRPTSSAWA